MKKCYSEIKTRFGKSEFKIHAISLSPWGEKENISIEINDNRSESIDDLRSLIRALQTTLSFLEES